MCVTTHRPYRHTIACKLDHVPPSAQCPARPTQRVALPHEGSSLTAQPPGCAAVAFIARAVRDQRSWKTSARSFHEIGEITMAAAPMTDPNCWIAQVDGAASAGMAQGFQIELDADRLAVLRRGILRRGIVGLRKCK